MYYVRRNNVKIKIPVARRNIYFIGLHCVVTISRINSRINSYRFSGEKSRVKLPRARETRLRYAIVAGRKFVKEVRDVIALSFLVYFRIEKGISRTRA